MALSDVRSSFEHENAVTETQCRNCRYFYQGFCIHHNEYVSKHEQENEECEDYRFLEKSLNTVNGRNR